MLAQDPRSPIVRHRHEIYDKAVVDGDVRLVIAVGRAAKESVATWIESHGGAAQPESLHTASLGSLPNRVRVVGVLHPGGASGGSTSAIKADFIRAIGRVRTWLQADPGVAAGRSGHDAEPVGDIPVLVGADPVSGFPVRHLPAPGTGRHVEQSQRRPAGHPAVLGGRQVQRGWRPPDRSVDGGRDRPGIRRRPGRPAVRAAARQPARLRPRPAGRPCAPVDGRRAGLRVAGLRGARRDRPSRRSASARSTVAGSRA